LCGVTNDLPHPTNISGVIMLWLLLQSIKHHMDDDDDDDDHYYDRGI